MSQMPWWIDWKCHLYSPVSRSMATIELENRLSPARCEPSCEDRLPPALPTVREDHPLADRYAAAGQGTAGLAVDPFGGTGCTVHGVDVAQCRLDVEHTVHRDRRALVGAGGEAAFDPVDPRGAETPQV